MPMPRLSALTRALAGALLLGLALPGAAGDAYQSHAAIRPAVRDFLLQRDASPGAEIEVQVDDLDPRLRLAACERPLEVFLPPSAPPAGRVKKRMWGVRGWQSHNLTPQTPTLRKDIMYWQHPKG